MLHIRLDNKREICGCAKRTSKAKHERIANQKYSTVSKLLTRKEKWLDLPPSKQTSYSSTFELWVSHHHCDMQCSKNRIVFIE